MAIYRTGGTGAAAAGLIQQVDEGMEQPCSDDLVPNRVLQGVRVINEGRRGRARERSRRFGKGAPR